MLSAKAQYNVTNAKGYFQEHLCVGDYYSQGQQTLGHWHGQGAEMLNLSGTTQGEEFVRLCENLHPQTGAQLTLRQKTTRTEIGPDGGEHQSANRRVFYDFTFSPAKSVSIVALAGNDSRIVEAHEEAVEEALTQLQNFSATRVRKQGQCTDRITDNLVAAVFRHETSRALDPHLHSHCIVFNATFDPAEKQWKALQNHEMLVAQKYVENVYYHTLARKLRSYGYEIENQSRGDFEIKGVSPTLIEKFSKRHREIDDKTQELLAHAPEKANGNVAAMRDFIAHKERARKIKDVGLARLQTMWDGQMTPEERASLQLHAQTPSLPASTDSELAEKAIVWAEDHLFDRHSVVPEHELWRHALEYARGQNLSLNELQSTTRRRDYIRDEKYSDKVTTREHLQREWEIVCLARDGVSRLRPMCLNYTRGSQLDDEQLQAVERIVHSRDFVTLFRGGAGTGKSFALREVQRGLREEGYAVQVVAPQRQQVMGLESDGLLNVETVSAFLNLRDLPRGMVVLVDEAGQIGGKQMHQLLQRISDHGCRVILSGDTRQHGAVEATDALRAIELHSGLHPIELTSIRRQNPALAKSIEERERIKEYRQAVVEARDGKLAESFRRLDKLGAIVACTLADRHEKLTARYLELAKEHQSTVIVSQSWEEIRKINEAIRTALQREKLMDETDSEVMTFQPVDLTDAQKRDHRSFNDRSMLVFNRDIGGFKAGDAARLRTITDTHLEVESDGRTARVPIKKLDRVTVCERKELALTGGDKVQLKANGRSTEGRKLANGELVVVKAVQRDGRIRLAVGRTLAPGFRQFVRGYAVTSYASQGKTVDHVLFSDSAVKAATSDQQWYVTISRGRKGVHIFTTDKQQLKENITRSGSRPLAIDLAPQRQQKSWVYRVMERKWGKRIAQIMELGRQAFTVNWLRQQPTQQIRQIPPMNPAPTPNQSRGIRV